MKDLSITVGFAPVYSPVFFGAKDYGFSIFPDLRFNYRDEFFASVPDGMGYNVINTESWKVGPLAKIRFDREEESGGSPFLISGESDVLRGMGNVDTAGEFGGFVQYTFSDIRTRLELRQGVGGHKGLIADLNVSYGYRFGPLNLRVGPRVSFATEDFINAYYGINEIQSLNTGLDIYSASSGFTSYGLGFSANMPLTDQAAVTMFGGYDRVASEIADSPLIRERGSENQFVIALAFGYRFGWDF